MSRTAWDVLGIEETLDGKAIRKAYALALKRTRPDEDAEGFQRLTDAFEWAVGWARHAAAQQAAEQSPEPDPAHDTLDIMPAAPADAMAVDADAAAGTGTDDADGQAQSFAFAPFFEEMAGKVRQRNPIVLRQWLDEHPDLYSIELKWALMPHVFDALAHSAVELDPHQGHLKVLMEFFGVDARLRQHPALAAPLNYLESASWRIPPPQRTGDVQGTKPGWDNLGAVLHNRAEERRRKPAESSSNWLHVLWLLLGLSVLSQVARQLSGS
ncbi:J domain-containing protein [Stenotrophomonas nitritireducens]|uniref:J domain-containing protein n=1 Tax=Stenotrophomonas nitritireducens TaxID=83617 RepID=UPI003D96E0F3